MRAMFSLRQPAVTAAAALWACLPGPACAEDTPAGISRDAEQVGSERREPAATPALPADPQNNGALRLDDVVVTGNAGASEQDAIERVDQHARRGSDSAAPALTAPRTSCAACLACWRNPPAAKAMPTSRRAACR